MPLIGMGKGVAYSTTMLRSWLVDADIDHLTCVIVKFHT